jgi:hypothetical protein
VLRLCGGEPWLGSEDSDVSRWRTFDLVKGGRVVLNPMPTVAAVYAIYYDGALMYVGSSVDVRNRFFLHNFRHTYGKGDLHTPWDDISDETHVTVKIKPTRRWGDFLMFEARLIRRLKPPMNRQHTGRKIKSKSR